MENIQDFIRSYLEEHQIDLDSLDISDEMKQSTIDDILATVVGAVTDAVLADPRLVAKMAATRASAAGAADAVEAYFDKGKDEIASSSLQKPSRTINYGQIEETYAAIKHKVETYVKKEVQKKVREEVTIWFSVEDLDEVREEIKDELKSEIRKGLRAELREELLAELREDLDLPHRPASSSSGGGGKKRGRKPKQT